ncbi:MAG TPA: glycosyltransferase [Gemmataceae bacterium]|nr:glycosyltransferase [Gemmataceae bacterium]
MRILLGLPEPPLPFGHAAARWFYVLLRGLAERGHRVTAFAACSRPEEILQARALFPAAAHDLRLYPHPRRKSVWNKWQTLRRPYSYTISPGFWRDFLRECSRGCDLLHLETTWCGWLGQGHDPSGTVLNVHSLYDIDEANEVPRSWSDRLRKALRRRAEHRLLGSAATLLALTPRLREALGAIAPRTPVHVVPLGLDLGLYPFIPAGQRLGPPLITLIGSMSWYPSRSAAVRLLTRLWPAIRRRVPGGKVQIVGWNAKEVLRPYLPQPDVEVAENVPETRPYFERTSVFLYAPERGSGMKVKVLEAFAYGVPVVTTSEGVEGLPAQDQVHAAVCEDDEGLVERTVALLGDRARQERQRRAARELVQNCCNPRVTLDGVERCYADVIARQRKVAA